MWRNIQFDFPQAMVLFMAVLLLLLLFAFLFHTRQRFLNLFINTEAAEETLCPHDPLLYWVKVVLFCLAWCLAVLALMQPKGNERYPIQTQTPIKGEKQRLAHDVIFLVDASASMSVQDARNQKTRLEFAKEVGDEILSRLKGDNAALHAFTSETLQLSPPTMDSLFVRLMLKDLKINEGETAGTDLAQALQTMKKNYFSHPSNKRKTLIILTDGGDTMAETLSGIEKEQRNNEILRVLDEAQDLNLRVFTIGMGSKEGRKIGGITYGGAPILSAENEQLLKKMAIRGRGAYYFANDENTVSIAEDIIRTLRQDSPYVEGSAAFRLPPIYDLYFQYPLLFAILCFMGFLLLPDQIKSIAQERS